MKKIKKSFVEIALLKGSVRYNLTYVAAKGRLRCGSDGNRLHVEAGAPPLSNDDWHIPLRPDLTYPAIDEIIGTLTFAGTLTLDTVQKSRVRVLCAAIEGANKHAVGAVLCITAAAYGVWVGIAGSGEIDCERMLKLSDTAQKDLRICVAARYVADVLDTIPSRSESPLTVQLPESPKGAIKISGPDSDSYAIVMPYRA